ASESSFYRVLREYGPGHRRGRAHPPRSVSRPQAWVAHAPLQVWSWDITFLPTTVRGQFYRLYLVLDVYSRMIVGWEVHVDERAEHASTLITKACMRHGVRREQLVLHRSANNSPTRARFTTRRLGRINSACVIHVSRRGSISSRTVGMLASKWLDCRFCPSTSTRREKNPGRLGS